MKKSAYKINYGSFMPKPGINLLKYVNIPSGTTLKDLHSMGTQNVCFLLIRSKQNSLGINLWCENL